MLHFLLKRKRVFFFAFLIILCVALITFGANKNKKFFPAVNTIQGFFSFPLNLTTLSINTLTKVWGGYVYLIDVEKRNAALQQKLNLLVLENQQLREHFLENQRLKSLLDFKQQFEHHMLPCEIIGRDPSSWFKTIIINRGTGSGVTQGSGVVSPRGVVGTVIETTLHSAKVLLITDQNSTIDIIVNRSRVRGILEGMTENTCRVKYVVKKEDVARGDEIITSGLNAVFPRGILVGTVIETNSNPDGFFKHIDVAPAVDFSKLSEVLVVMKKQPAPATHATP